MIFAEAFGIFFDKVLKHLEKHFEFFFALLIIFQLEMNLGKIKQQPDEERSEFVVAVA